MCNVKRAAALKCQIGEITDKIKGLPNFPHHWIAVTKLKRRRVHLMDEVAALGM